MEFLFYESCFMMMHVSWLIFFVARVPALGTKPPTRNSQLTLRSHFWNRFYRFVKALGRFEQINVFWPHVTNASGWVAQSTLAHDFSLMSTTVWELCRLSVEILESNSPLNDGYSLCEFSPLPDISLFSRLFQRYSNRAFLELNNVHQISMILYGPPI